MHVSSSFIPEAGPGRCRWFLGQLFSWLAQCHLVQLKFKFHSFVAHHTDISPLYILKRATYFLLNCSPMGEHFGISKETACVIWWKITPVVNGKFYLSPLWLRQCRHWLFCDFFFLIFFYCFFIYAGCSRKEITEHWEWLEQNLLQTLSIFENENDINTFVRGKIQVVMYIIVNADRYDWKEDCCESREMQCNAPKAAPSLKLGQILNSNFYKNEENSD